MPPKAEVNSEHQRNGDGALRVGGGGMASLKADPLAKAFAQMLLDMPVRVPASLAQKLAA
jgi:hypothetical protein